MPNRAVLNIRFVFASVRIAVSIPYNIDQCDRSTWFHGVMPGYTDRPTCRLAMMLVGYICRRMLFMGSVCLCPAAPNWFTINSAVMHRVTVT